MVWPSIHIIIHGMLEQIWELFLEVQIADKVGMQLTTMKLNLILIFHTLLLHLMDPLLHLDPLCALCGSE